MIVAKLSMVSIIVRIALGIYIKLVSVHIMGTMMRVIVQRVCLHQRRSHHRKNNKKTKKHAHHEATIKEKAISCKAFLN